MRIATLAAASSVLLSLASLATTSARAQDEAIELPERVLVFLNQMSSADSDHQQTALLEVGNVLRERGIAFEVEDDTTCTGTSDGCLRLALDDDRADAVLILSVYHSGDEGSVDLQVFDGSMSGEGTESWVGDPAAAAGRAMRTALDTFRPETVRVTLTGTPEGATVWLGRRTGHLPLITTITPGEHRLRVSADGYLTHHETVTIPATDTEWNHRVALEPGDDPDVLDDHDDATTSGSRNGALIGLGVTSALLGAGAIAAGAILLGQDGCELEGCARSPDDPAIIPRKETTAGGVTLLVGGAVLVALGVGFTIAGIRVEPQADATGARLSIHGAF